MNKLDTEIFYMIKNYPSIFPNRKEALEQLFIVNGNGCEWIEDGTLYHPKDERDIFPTSLEAYIKENEWLHKGDSRFIEHQTENYYKEKVISESALERTNTKHTDEFIKDNYCTDKALAIYGYENVTKDSFMYNKFLEELVYNVYPLYDKDNYSCLAYMVNILIDNGSIEESFLDGALECIHYSKLIIQDTPPFEKKFEENMNSLDILKYWEEKIFELTGKKYDNNIEV